MIAIIVNTPLFRQKNELYDEDSLPPIGLGYIATALQENGIDTQLIDCVDKRISLEDLTSILNESKPDFTALNIFTTNYELVKEITESLNYKTHVVIGGLSTKQLYKDILNWKTSNTITVVTGDGELIILDIINNQLKEPPFYSSGKHQVFFVESKSIYHVKDISNVSLNRAFFSNEPIKHPLGFVEANIVTSRGCIYDCAFCAAARSLNKQYGIRERATDSIINEIKEIIQLYPDVNSIRVLDDLFLKTSKTVQKAINIFRHFKLNWRSMAHVMTFHHTDEILMSELKKSGCFELFVGIESGSPKILSLINKTKEPNVVLNNLSKVLKAGIHLKGYFIYGFPDETADDMEMTYQLAKKLHEIAEECNVSFRTSVFQYRPYHGTEIYHYLEEKGVNLNIKPIEPNQALSALVGRLQFNFHSGNYSKVDDKLLADYIYRTINLNDGKIFARLEKNNKAL